jgi:hypothetical protein
VEPDDAVPAANSCAVHGIDGNGSSTVRADEAPGGAWTNVAAMVINFASITATRTRAPARSSARHYGCSVNFGSAGLFAALEPLLSELPPALASMDFSALSALAATAQARRPDKTNARARPRTNDATTPRTKASLAAGGHRSSVRKAARWLVQLFGKFKDAHR